MSFGNRLGTWCVAYNIWLRDPSSSCFLFFMNFIKHTEVSTKSSTLRGTTDMCFADCGLANHVQSVIPMIMLIRCLNFYSQLFVSNRCWKHAFPQVYYVFHPSLLLNIS